MCSNITRIASMTQATPRMIAFCYCFHRKTASSNDGMVNPYIAQSCVVIAIAIGLTCWLSHGADAQTPLAVSGPDRSGVAPSPPLGVVRPGKSRSSPTVPYGPPSDPRIHRGNELTNQSARNLENTSASTTPSSAGPDAGGETGDSSQARRIAVLIGTNTYLDKQFSTLNSCVRDVRLLCDVLIQHAGFLKEDILVLADDEPTLHRQPLVENYRTHVLERFQAARPQDAMLIYFSGHGVLDEQRRGYLATANCDANNLEQTAIPLASLRAEIRNCQARRKVLLLDCCHAGTTKSSQARTPVAAPAARAIEEHFANSSGFLTVASCGSDEFSHEWRQANHGLFTFFVAEALRGAGDVNRDGVVDSDELYRYTYNKVTITARDVLHAKQTPRRFSDETVGIFPLSVKLAPVPPSRPDVAVNPQREPPSLLHARQLVLGANLTVARVIGPGILRKTDNGDEAADKQMSFNAGETVVVREITSTGIRIASLLGGKVGWLSHEDFQHHFQVN